MENEELIKAKLRETTEVFLLPEILDMVEAVAELTSIYYHALIKRGIAPDAAATITAGYSNNIGKI